MQKRNDDFTVFWWPRGQSQRWHLAERDGQTVLAFDGTLVDPGARTYGPLAETPQPYSDFSALGQRALNAGRRLAGNATLGPVDAALFAAGDNGIQREALRFVRQYGPVLPTPLTGPIVYTRQPAPRPTFADLEDAQGRVRIVLSDFLRQASTFFEAVRLVKEVRDAEGFDDDAGEFGDDPELSEKQARLQSLFWERLEGRVGLGLTVAGGKIEGRATCSDLESAMWLQLYEDLAGGRRWHICKGCGRLFGAAHGLQEYHDKRCRDRAWARQHRGGEQ